MYFPIAKLHSMYRHGEMVKYIDKWPAPLG